MRGILLDGGRGVREQTAQCCFRTQTVVLVDEDRRHRSQGPLAGGRVMGPDHRADGHIVDAVPLSDCSSSLSGTHSQCSSGSNSPPHLQTLPPRAAPQQLVQILVVLAGSLFLNVRYRSTGNTIAPAHIASTIVSRRCSIRVEKSMRRHPIKMLPHNDVTISPHSRAVRRFSRS